MSVSTCILIYGQDRLLLETRRWVLERAGFQVSTTTELTDVEQIATIQHIDLFILCHTLSSEQLKRAFALAHALRPKRQILVLAEPNTPPSAEGHQVLSGLTDPLTLIAAVQRMTTHSGLTT